MKQRKYEITEFGKFVRILRAEHNEYQKDMANNLKMEATNLCSYELGRHKIPQRLAYTIADVYKLSDEKKEELINIINNHNISRLRHTEQKRKETQQKLEEEKATKEQDDRLDRIESKLDICISNLNSLMTMLSETNKKKRWF